METASLSVSCRPGRCLRPRAGRGIPWGSLRVHLWLRASARRVSSTSAAGGSGVPTASRIP